MENEYRKCRFEFMPHVFERAVERNFPLNKFKDMIYRSKWLAHIEPLKRTCVYKNGTKYWTIIVIPYKCHIFILTLYQSKYDEIRRFKAFKSNNINKVKP